MDFPLLATSPTFLLSRWNTETSKRSRVFASPIALMSKQLMGAFPRIAYGAHGPERALKKSIMFSHLWSLDAFLVFKSLGIRHKAAH
jgi:hypothetical protein